MAAANQENSKGNFLDMMKATIDSFSGSKTKRILDVLAEPTATDEDKIPNQTTGPYRSDWRNAAIYARRCLIPPYLDQAWLQRRLTEIPERFGSADAVPESVTIDSSKASDESIVTWASTADKEHCIESIVEDVRERHDAEERVVMLKAELNVRLKLAWHQDWFDD